MESEKQRKEVGTELLLGGSSPGDGDYGELFRLNTSLNNGKRQKATCALCRTHHGRTMFLREAGELC